MITNGLYWLFHLIKIIHYLIQVWKQVHVYTRFKWINTIQLVWSKKRNGLIRKWKYRSRFFVWVNKKLARLAKFLEVTGESINEVYKFLVVYTSIFRGRFVWNVSVKLLKKENQEFVNFGTRNIVFAWKVNLISEDDYQYHGYEHELEHEPELEHELSISMSLSLGLSMSLSTNMSIIIISLAGLKTSKS